jgi:hypothetical protein
MARSVTAKYDFFGGNMGSSFDLNGAKDGLKFILHDDVVGT